MAAINFGYTISKPRAIDIDRNNLRKSDEILHEMPELQACILRFSLYSAIMVQILQCPYKNV